MSRDPEEAGSPDFLNRWSARKSRLRAERDDASVERHEDSADRPGADPSPPALTDADMPPLDSLDGGSDLSAFLGDGISATLRKAALRRVFSAASFNVRDGLNDYDGDYTVFEPLGDTVTADMKFHAARRERLAREKREAEALAAAEDEAGEEAGGDRQDEAQDSAVDESTDGPDDEAPSEPVDVATGEPAHDPLCRPAGGLDGTGSDETGSGADLASGDTTLPTPTEKRPPA